MVSQEQLVGSLFKRPQHIRMLLQNAGQKNLHKSQGILNPLVLKSFDLIAQVQDFINYLLKLYRQIIGINMATILNLGCVMGILYIQERNMRMW